MLTVDRMIVWKSNEEKPKFCFSWGFGEATNIDNLKN